LTVEERKLGLSTIMSHLAKLYVDGAEIDLDSFISKEEVLQIADAQIKLESPNALKPYFDYFEEKIDYGKIRIGISNRKRECCTLNLRYDSIFSTVC
jgi:ATP-dependent DNA helicase RecQ